jgi:hypothetical protein
MCFRSRCLSLSDLEIISDSKWKSSLLSFVRPFVILRFARIRIYSLSRLTGLLRSTVGTFQLRKQEEVARGREESFRLPLWFLDFLCFSDFLVGTYSHLFSLQRGRGLLLFFFLFFASAHKGACEGRICERRLKQLHHTPTLAKK